ncbi:helix-turn-helix domain-containing protein [Streptomyces sp. 5-10]|nr:helix-turn-helix domain-containing protein [Streptomyces sp. 5-10]
MAWALECPHGEVSIMDLAARSYMSRRNFNRRFRELTGTAPLQWLLGQRVEWARKLLETTDCPVAEVAERCGFRSPVMLRLTFRKQLGVTPTEYRASHRPQG